MFRRRSLGESPALVLRAMIIVDAEEGQGGDGPDEPDEPEHRPRRRY